MRDKNRMVHPQFPLHDDQHRPLREQPLRQHDRQREREFWSADFSFLVLFLFVRAKRKNIQIQFILFIKDAKEDIPQ